MSADQVLIVGAGDCGTRAAMRLRELDASVRIVLVGDETTEPYERPPLSKRVISDVEEPPSIATEQDLTDRAILWERGCPAVRLEPKRHRVTLADGRRFAYDRLLIATGSRARRLAVPGASEQLVVRSIADARRLRTDLHEASSLLIVGGGFIGLEVAASARRAGVAATVVEFAHQLMSRVVPGPVAERIARRHRIEGVDLRLGVGVDRVSTAGGRPCAQLDDGDAVCGDLLVAGVGAIPNTELAATAGLALSNGIAVDEHLHTSDPDIFAAGDCCSVPHPLYDGRRIRLEAWRNALAQSEVAARNLLGERLVFDAVPSFWSDQYDLTLEVVGLHAAATSEIVRRRTDGTEIRFGVDSAGRIVSASGVAVGTGLARDMRLAERLIAARLAPDAADLSNTDLDLRALL